MGKSKPKLGDMVPIDVRILDVGSIPAKYFLHDEVIEALHRVVRSDVVVHGNPVPPGAEPVMGRESMATANQRVRIASSDLGYQLRRGLPGVIFILIIAAGSTVIAWLVWRALNG